MKDPHPFVNTQEGFPEDDSGVSFVKTRQRKILFVVGQDGIRHRGGRGHIAHAVRQEELHTAYTG